MTTVPLLLDGRPVDVDNPLPAELLQPATTVFRTLTTVTAGQVVGDTGPASSTGNGTVTGLAATSGAGLIPVVVSGDLPVTAPWPVGTDLYLGTDGFPTPDPNTGSRTVPIGHVSSLGVITVRLGLTVVRAAP